MARTVLLLAALAALLAAPAFAGSTAVLALAGESPGAAVWVRVAPEDWHPDPDGSGYRLTVGASTQGLADGEGVTAIGIFEKEYGRLDGYVRTHTGDFGGYSYTPWAAEPYATEFLVVVGRDGVADGEVTIRAPGAAPLAWDATGLGTQAARVYRDVFEGEVRSDVSAGMTYEVVPPDPASGRLFETVRLAYDHEVATRSIHVAELRILSRDTTATIEGSYVLGNRRGEEHALYAQGYGQAFYLLGGTVNDRASAELVVRTTPRGDFWDWASVATIPVDPSALGTYGPYDARFGGVEAWSVPDDAMRCAVRAPDGPDAWVDCVPAQV